MKRYDYIETLKEQILIFDGAMGTNLDRQQLTAADYGGEQYQGCNDVLNLTNPSSVETVHRSFFDVGVDVIETNSFRANRITLEEFGLAEKTHQINLAAAQLARGIADEYSHHGQQRFVAGSMGPTGKLISIDSEQGNSLHFTQIVDVYKQQALALIEGGVDLLLLETQQDLLEVKAAILGVRKACFELNIHVPIQAQVTMDIYNRMLLGSEIDAVEATLEQMDIDVIGLNCSTGPQEMERPIDFLGKHANLPVSCIPNAGMPEMQNGNTVYPLDPNEFAASLTGFIERYGISVVGGCCGTGPEHLKELVSNVRGHPAPARKASVKSVISSPMNSTELRQTPAPLIIGERLNTQGSRNFKKIILEEDFQKALSLAQKQVNNGAHALDLCTALTENQKELENMVKLIRTISHSVNVPLVIDTTDLQVMEAALQATPGRCLINSTNFEAGEEKAKAVFQLAKKYGAAVMVLTIDEEGMAKTAEEKMAMVERAYDIAVNQIGLAPGALVIDPLTFSLASGDEETINSAKDTLKTIQLIKQEYPSCHTSLGVSNISFGFTKNARKQLNSVFLYHAIKTGLDMAILNAAGMMSYDDIPENERIAAEDLIFNSHPKALDDFIQVFIEKDSKPDASSSIEPFEEVPLGERIFKRISKRSKEGLEQDIENFIALESQDSTKNDAALLLLNEYLLPAMQEVGDKFGRGEIILPFVLQSSEIMRAATEKLNKYFSKEEDEAEERILLATVYGDVHDIGKNLVKTILENNGFHVNDLGKQVPADQIVKVALDQNVRAIGLSALLVNTSQQMPLIIRKLQEVDSEIPVLIGGAAVNQSFAEHISVDNNGAPYKGGVHYCKDAFDALKVLSME